MYLQARTRPGSAESGPAKREMHRSRTSETRMKACQACRKSCGPAAYQKRKEHRKQRDKSCNCLPKWTVADHDKLRQQVKMLEIQNKRLQHELRQSLKAREDLQDALAERNGLFKAPASAPVPHRQLLSNLELPSWATCTDQSDEVVTAVSRKMGRTVHDGGSAIYSCRIGTAAVCPLIATLTFWHHALDFFFANSKS